MAGMTAPKGAVLTIAALAAMAGAIGINQFGLWILTVPACVLFIAFGTTLDQKARNRVLIGMLFLNVFVTDIGLLRDVAEGTTINPQAWLKAPVYAASLGLGALLIRPGRIERNSLLTLLYCALCIASTSYSVDRGITFAAGGVLLSQIVVIVALASQFDSPQDAFATSRVLIAALATKVCVSWLIAMFLPQYGFAATGALAVFEPAGLNRFGGLANPNTTGMNAALLAAMSFPILIGAQRRWLNPFLFTFLTGVVTTIATQSRTAVVALLVSLVVSALVVVRRSAALAVSLGLLLLVIWIGTDIAELARYSSRTGAESETLSMNGRTSIWNEVIWKVEDAPILGYGYGTGRVVVGSLVIPGSWRPFYSAHNAVLESMISVGAMGTILLLWLVVQCLGSVIRGIRRHLRGSRERAEFATLAAVITLVLTSGIAESGIAAVQNVLALAFFWALLATTSLEQLETRGVVILDGVAAPRLGPA